MLKNNKEVADLVLPSLFLQEHFVLPSSEKISPGLTQSSASSSKTTKLTRSRSCKASLMRDPFSDWFDQEEMIQNTPPIGRPGGLQRKTYTLNYNPNAERLSWAGYENSLGRASDAQNMKSSTNNGSYNDNSLAPVRKEKNDLESSNMQANLEVCF